MHTALYTHGPNTDALNTGAPNTDGPNTDGPNTVGPNTDGPNAHGPKQIHTALIHVLVACVGRRTETCATGTPVCVCRQGRGTAQIHSGDLHC